MERTKVFEMHFMAKSATCVFELISRVKFYKTQGEFDSVQTTHTTVYDKIAFEISTDDFCPDGRACGDNAI